MKDISLFISKYNFRMTDANFSLDNEKYAARFCLSDKEADGEANRDKIWINGYCLFYISKGGLGLYLYIGRGIDPSAISLGIDNNNDPYKLKITGVDEI